ncbi:dsDNA nuclease domain-containing protein, partial [Pseudomonas viridiflava]|uniref:dsDNA nuclease domain-containing protein n=1 Tax=Pseudomonas viridiflava TaxID=33069 RepID=UPI00311AA520
MSKRDIAKALEYFAKELDRRVTPDLATQRGLTLAKQLKTVSARGRDCSYWADNFVWQVCGDASSLEATNLRVLAEVIDLYGETPSHRQQKEIYDAFLTWADDAATADVKTVPEKKIISRVAALARLKALLGAAAKHSAAFAKPYKTKPDPFLVEFHTTTEDG